MNQRAETKAATLTTALRVKSETRDTAESYETWRDQFALERLRVLYVVGLIANPVFFILDILAHPAFVHSLLILRVILQLGLLAGYVALKTRILRIKPATLLTFWVLWPSLIVAHMTVLTGGFSSQYYSGLGLVFLGAAVIVPISWLSHLSAQIVTLLYYYGANFFATSGAVETSQAIQNSFFIGWTCVALIISVVLYERLQRAEFQARLAERDARRELEVSHRKLLELDRLKNEFFANISHELRTPLTLILGAFNKLLKPSSRMEQQDTVNAGLRNTSRLLILINELLDLARFDSGRAEVNKKLINFTQLVRSVAANFESSKRRRIHYRGLDQPIAVEADPGQLKKVLFNLLSNAFKFSDPDDGQVWLKLAVTEQTVKLEVEDNGIGIAREHLERIFDRFTQIEGSAARKYEGSGIGLALVKEVVTLHGGQITVESELDRGSTFAVTLPRATVSGGELAEIEEEDALFALSAKAQLDAQVFESGVADGAGDKSLILVADDNADMRNYLARTLQNHYRILLAKDGVEALKQTQVHQPDLILTDVMMPHMSGYDLLTAVKNDANLRGIPVIFLTARAGTEARIETLELGADDYITKPFEEPEVLARVKNLIAARHQERELIRLQNEKLAQFLPSQLSKLILSGTAEEYLKPHRRHVTVIFIDLRGFTAFSETADPEDVMAVLEEYHTNMGRIVMRHQGTIKEFSGDGIVILLNDPIPVENHPKLAVRMALAMKDQVAHLREQWIKRGFELGGGIGIATGYATLGVIGFDRQKDYAAIGTVINLAARLCGAAQHGQILVPERLRELVNDLADTELVGPLDLKGFHQSITVYNIVTLRN